MKSAVVGVLAVALLLTACSASPGPTGAESATSSPSNSSPSTSSPSTSSPSTSSAPPTLASPAPASSAPPTEAPAVAAAPKRIYSGTATCANLLSASRVAGYLADGSTVTDDSYSRKIATEAAQNSFPLGLATFISYGGIACGWGDGYENRIIFGYGPITAEQAADAKAALVKHHLKKAADSTFERYDGDSADWAFGNGYWAYASDNGGGNVLSEVVAHAPHWLHPANDTKPAPTALTTRVVRAATGPYLSTEGLGSLRLGKPVSATNPFVAFVPKTCFASWLAKAPYGDARLGTQALDVLTAAHRRSSKLTGIILRTAAIPTKSGIRVGDSLATLESVFDTFDATVRFEESTGYVIGDAHGKVVFDVATEDSPTGSYLAGQIRAISLFPATATGMELSADYWAPCTL